MGEEMDAIKWSKTTAEIYWTQVALFRRPRSGKALRQLAKCADVNNEVTERDTSTNLFVEREIFATKIPALKKRTHGKISVKWRSC